MGMKQAVGKIAQSGFRRLGYQFKRLNRNFDDIIREISYKSGWASSQVTIFDVGANNGSSIERFKRLFPTPAPKIFSFEPNRTLASHLTEKYRGEPSITIFNEGVGVSETTLEFLEQKSSHGSSSFVPVSGDTRFARRRGISDSSIEKYQVDVISLDSFARNKGISHINLLKIDVQGFEEDVLAGCKQLFETQAIDMIEVEVIVTPVYQRRVSFFDIEKNLVPYGYKLVALSNDGRFYNLTPFDVFQNPELQFDVIYLSPSMYDRLVAL